MIGTKRVRPPVPSEAEPEAVLVSERPTVASDEALLRRHAPILRLDRRELFLPTSADAYVRSCELVCRDGRRIPGPDLHELDERWSAGTYLRFVSPEDRRSLTKTQRRTGGRRHHAPRLGRVGVFGRLVDALFLLSVWIRATTPRLTTAAAAAKAERCHLHRSPTCYARSVQAGEWTILHYAYFYVMNDWRSGFRGLNDHEGDWEQIWVFCDPETRQPVWVSATSHDHDGADRRRHWNDPELELADERPVLYVAAGSHALYFRPGDYVTRIDVPGFRGLILARDLIRRALRIRGDAAERGVGPAVGVPFIDAANGDGLTIEAIEIRLMDNQDWLESYRGLWGLDTGDPLQGERGPGGPKFDRQGEIRESWADPLGCAGLHGTPPPSAAARQVNIDNLDHALLLLDEQIRERRRYLPLASQTNSANELAEESRRLTELLRQRCELEGLRTRLLQRRWRTDGIRDHLRRPGLPLAPTDRGSLLLGTWAALSIPAFLAALAAVLLLDAVQVGLALQIVILFTLPIEYLASRNVRSALRLLAAEVTVAGLARFGLGGAWSVRHDIVGAVLAASAVTLLAANIDELTNTHRPNRSWPHLASRSPHSPED